MMTTPLHLRKQTLPSRTELSYSTVASVHPIEQPTLSSELNRLFCAAIVNRRFQQYLLRDPLGAVDAGYNDERFELTDQERQALQSVRASSIEELAAQVIARLDQGPVAETEVDAQQASDSDQPLQTNVEIRAHRLSAHLPPAGQ